MTDVPEAIRATLKARRTGSPEFAEAMRWLGRRGGKRRLETMTPEERSAISGPPAKGRRRGD